MRTVREKIVSMLYQLPEQQLEKVVNYILLLKNGADTQHDIFIKNSELYQKIEKYHDLDILAGTWSDEETEEFLHSISDFGEVDNMLWK